MYTDCAPQIKDNHFIMTYQLADLFSGNIENLQKLGITTKQFEQQCDEEEYQSFNIDGVEYELSDEAGFIQTCETEVVDGEVESMFQFRTDCEIWLTSMSGYRGVGNYEAIVKQNDKLYFLDIVSEGMAYVLEPVQAVMQA